MASVTSQLRTPGLTARSAISPAWYAAWRRLARVPVMGPEAPTTKLLGGRGVHQRTARKHVLYI